MSGLNRAKVRRCQSSVDLIGDHSSGTSSLSRQAKPGSAAAAADELVLAVPTPGGRGQFSGVQGSVAMGDPEDPLGQSHGGVGMGATFQQPLAHCHAGTGASLTRRSVTDLLGCPDLILG